MATKKFLRSVARCRRGKELISSHRHVDENREVSLLEIALVAGPRDAVWASRFYPDGEVMSLHTALVKMVRRVVRAYESNKTENDNDALPPMLEDHPLYWEKRANECAAEAVNGVLPWHLSLIKLHTVAKRALRSVGYYDGQEVNALITAAMYGTRGAKECPQ